MTEYQKQRRVPRIALPSRPAARTRVTEAVRLLDVSLNGARVEHLNLLRPGAYLSVDGLAGDRDVPKISATVAERGYPAETIDLILGENFPRVFRSVPKA